MSGNKKQISRKKQLLSTPSTFLKVLFFIVFGLIVITLSLFVGYLLGKKQTDTQESLVEISPTSIPQEIPTEVIKPTNTPIPPIQNNQPGKIALHVDVIDHSDGRPAGLITDVTVQLYNMEGTLLEEKKPSVYVQDGPVGSGGEAIFYVLPSTYKVSADTGSSAGTCTITVRTTTEYNSCAIYVVRK